MNSYQLAYNWLTKGVHSGNGENTRRDSCRPCSALVDFCTDRRPHGDYQGSARSAHCRGDRVRSGPFHDAALALSSRDTVLAK